MGIDLYWDNEEQTVMLAEFNGKWEWDELYAVLKTIKKLSEERQQVFGAIIDIRSGLHLPGGSVFNREGLSQFRRLTSLGSGGKGPVAILGMSGMIRRIFETVGNMDRNATQDVYFAADMDEARRTIYGKVAQINTASA